MAYTNKEKSLVDYRIAMALVRNLEKAGKLSAASARLLCTKLAEKYGVKSGSIFAP